MKLFFRYQLPAIDEPDVQLAWGIHTANQQLLLALHRHSNVIRQFSIVPRDENDSPRLMAMFGDDRVQAHPLSTAEEAAAMLGRHEIVFVGGFKMESFLGATDRLLPNASIIGFTHSLHLPTIPESLHQTACLATSNDVLVCSSTTAERVVHAMLGPLENHLRTSVIPLGVDLQAFRPAEPGEKSKLREALDIPRDATLILSVGRFTSVDKAELAPLLKAFARRSPKSRGLQLALLGREHMPGYVAILEQLIRELGIEDNARVVTRYKAQDLPAYYRAADIFVLPSDNIQETFGQVVLEAMASALPVVASDWNGLKDLVVNGETGFLIPTYWAECGIESTERFALTQSIAVDFLSLELALEDLITNAELRDRMGTGARKRAAALFSWPQIVRRYDALFREATSTPRGTPMPPLASGRSAMPSTTTLFASYPTRMLDDAMELRLMGLDANVYSQVAVLANPAVADALPRLLQNAPMPVGRLVAELRQLGLTTEQATFQILLFAKHAILSIHAPEGHPQ